MRIVLVVAKSLLALCIFDASAVFITGFIVRTRFRSNSIRETCLSVGKFDFGRGYVANGAPSGSGRRGGDKKIEDALEERLASIAQMERDIEQRLISLSQKERALQQQDNRRPGPGGPRASIVSNDYTIGKHLEIFGSQSSDKDTLDVGAIRDQSYNNRRESDRSRLTENKLYSPLGSTQSPYSSSGSGTSGLRIGPSGDEGINDAYLERSTAESSQEGDYSKAVLATIAVGLGSALAFAAVNQNSVPSDQWTSLGARTNNWMESMRPASSKIKDSESMPLEAATNKLMEKLNTGASMESGVVKAAKPTEQVGKTTESEKKVVEVSKVVEKEPVNVAPKVEKPVMEVPKLVSDAVPAPKSSEMVTKAETTGVSKSANEAAQIKVESPIAPKISDETPPIYKLPEETVKPKADDSIISGISKAVESSATAKSSDEPVIAKVEKPVSSLSTEDVTKAKSESPSISKTSSETVTPKVDSPVATKSPDEVGGIKIETPAIPKSSDVILKEELSDAVLKSKSNSIEETSKILGKAEETESKFSPPKDSGTTVKLETTVTPDPTRITAVPVAQPTGTAVAKETLTIAEPKSTPTIASVDAVPKVAAAEAVLSKGTQDAATITASKIESSVSNAMKTEESASKAIPMKTAQEDLLKEAAVNTFMKALVAGDVSVESAAKVEDAIEAFLKSREAARRSTVAVKPNVPDSGSSNIPVDTVVSTILDQLRAGVTLEIKAKAPDSRNVS